MTVKGGRKSGDFVEQKGIENMEQCSQKCCSDPDKKCNLAFMLGKACYSVHCFNKELCQTIDAPATKFNPLVQYVRGLSDDDDGAGVDTTAGPVSLDQAASPGLCVLCTTFSKGST